MTWLRYLKWRFLTRRVKITVLYKSGAKVHTKVVKFSWKSVGGGISYEWENMRPNVLRLNADDVSAVWHGWV